MLKRTISVVVPCYNEEKSLPGFYDAMAAIVERLPQAKLELCFVDDGSSDGTLSILRQKAGEDRRVRYVSLSRNFGKEAAMRAGLEMATGDYTVFMDADLQHPPELLLEMFDLLESGEWDLVIAHRRQRESDGWVRRTVAKLFYKVFNGLTSLGLEPGATDYCMMTRPVREAVLSMGEHGRFTKGILRYVGYRVRWMSYPDVGRAVGNSKWTFGRLLDYSLNGVLAFSHQFPKWAMVLGTLAALPSALTMLSALFLPTEIWLAHINFLLVTPAVFLTGGVLLFFMGIFGQYIVQTDLETRRRPMYFIKETEKDRGAP